jgi:hypothetical protein
VVAHTASPTAARDWASACTVLTPFRQIDMIRLGLDSHVVGDGEHTWDGWGHMWNGWARCWMMLGWALVLRLTVRGVVALSRNSRRDTRDDRDRTGR